MFRRQFLAGTAAAAATTALPVRALADVLQYEPGLLTTHMSRGDTVLLDFTASWCTTCQAQRRVLDELKAANPSYNEHLVFIDVDWDRYGRSKLVRRLRVPSRSTLLLIKDDKELGRVIARTNHRVIQELLDIGVSAARG